MKIGVLTAALQELTPREVRDNDPDRAIEEWVGVRARARRRLHPALGRAAPDEGRRAAPRPCSTRWPTRSTSRKPFDKDRAKRVKAALEGARRSASRTSATSTTCCTTTRRIRRKKHDFMKRAMDAAVLLGVDAVCGFVGRNQEHSMDQNLVDFERELRPAAEVREGARAHLPRRAVPDAGLDHEGQLAQQHRLHARDLDRAAPHLREARRGRPVPHPLRPVARDPDGPGHALALPVPEGRGLQLPDRRLPREGPGDRRQGRLGLGLRRPDRRARRLEERQALAEARPTRSTPGRSRWCSASTSCPARRSTTRSPTCRTARWTGSTTSSRRASC